MDSSHNATAELPKEKNSFDTKAIWKTFWILLVITLVELMLAMLHFKYGFLPRHLLNGVFIILTMAKAFFIIAEFMHLGHELKNLIMTIAIPALLFVWFLVAFLWDGGSYHNLRMRYDSYQNEQSKTKVKKVEHHEEGKKPGVE